MKRTEMFFKKLEFLVAACFIIFKFVYFISKNKRPNVTAKLVKLTFEDILSTQKSISGSHVLVRGSSNRDFACHRNYFRMWVSSSPFHLSIL